MANRYVDVVITRETKPVSEQGFGLPLVLATSKDLDYKEYTDISEVANDFDESSKEYKLLSRMFGQNPRPTKIAVFGIDYESGVDAPLTLVSALNDLIKQHNDFYYLVSPEQGDNEIKALAEWVNTRDKIFGATTSNISLAEEVKGMYDHTFLVIHDQPETYVAEGLVATLAPRQIGSYTWTFKTVQGVPAVNFDNATINRIHEANASTYINEAGILMNSHGVVTSGEYIDIIQSTHFLKARLAEYVFRLLALKEKVPYTDAGIALVVAEVEKVLNLAYEQGIIADDEVGNPMFSVSVPKRADIPKNTIAQRILPDVHWTATIAGAVEKVQIRGVLTL